ncbi:hypothetical protein ASPBRDRAFT_120644 [Aspergillus brasiliensis CBS 101740]|uniref:Uncharacterized protein n=1 Tax=Aspergillus brasiliensis (strain CBS 101740 / IMI 381727 / IBT 21946) TaxID=767769 RepID=A0A1L9UUE8_ASPBC|nr:hypothetical protein ASPBRDRAFT_120644 [Aspergillus brasiliensis CBS 101740]
MGDQVSNSSIPPQFLAKGWEEHSAQVNQFCAFFERVCCCYICGFTFYSSSSHYPSFFKAQGDESYPRLPNYKSVAKDEGVDEREFESRYVPNQWWMWQRMILHREATSTYQVSGTYIASHCISALRVPITVEGQRVYIKPKVYCRDKATKRSPADWVGCAVHARCWELLSHHALGRFAESNLPAVLAALRFRRCVIGSPCRRWRHWMFAEGKSWVLSRQYM